MTFADKIKTKLNVSPTKQALERLDQYKDFGNFSKGLFKLHMDTKHNIN